MFDWFYIIGTSFMKELISNTEAATGGVLYKKVFLEISQNS